MKADHLLIILGLMIIVLVATQTLWQQTTAATMVDRDCVLFYGSLGENAEQQCRTKLLQQHSRRGDVPGVRGPSLLTDKL